MTVASPTSSAVASPLALMFKIAGLELTQSGSAPDGGTPEPKSAFTVNCFPCQTLNTAISGRIDTELTFAKAVAPVLEVGCVGTPEFVLQATEIPNVRIVTTKAATRNSDI